MKKLLALFSLIVHILLYQRRGGDGPGKPPDGPENKPGGVPGRPAPVKDAADGQKKVGDEALKGRSSGRRAGRKRPSRKRDPNVPKPDPAKPRDANGPVPGHYQQVGYGTTPESQLAQAARLRDNNNRNMYGAATFKDSQGNSYQVSGSSDATKHAEGDIVKNMIQEIAQRQGVRPDQVDLKSELRDVKLYVEWSPCPTGNRCADLVEQKLPDDAQIQYSWPWQPRDAQASSRDSAKEAIAELFNRGRPGPQ
ncbi:nucleic acid/nucleotide deaminase domain-containing protein [Amycolatopsis sp. 195334CR]|uniref:nucleic acid/nucleotide deaminase domain-containing protein n=1 Tax=Amycolatopsis sp. 195334CR TaxID=2814588 RepID=UPI001A8CEFB8|nr:nucleic acid/nucleotide deaminase domain-containing protein [Amycolatopsis sp. 195334CR]MBN6039104.1 hypothetical protein [Amycolatopsis sp. 195334CR]